MQTWNNNSNNKVIRVVIHQIKRKRKVLNNYNNNKAI